MSEAILDFLPQKTVLLTALEGTQAKPAGNHFEGQPLKA